MSVSTRLTLSSRCSDAPAKNSDGNTYFGSLAALLGGKSEKKVSGEKPFTLRTVILVSLAAAGGTTAFILYRRARQEEEKGDWLNFSSLLQFLRVFDTHDFVRPLSRTDAARIEMLQSIQQRALGQITPSSCLVLDSKLRPSNGFEGIGAFKTVLSDAVEQIRHITGSDFVNATSENTQYAVDCIELIAEYQQHYFWGQSNQNPNTYFMLFLEDLKRVCVSCLDRASASTRFGNVMQTQSPNGSRNNYNEGITAKDDEDFTLLSKFQQSAQIQAISGCCNYLSLLLDDASFPNTGFEGCFPGETLRTHRQSNENKPRLAQMLQNIEKVMVSGLAGVLKHRTELRLLPLLQDLHQHALQCFREGRSCLKGLLMADSDINDVLGINIHEGSVTTEPMTLDEILQHVVRSVPALLEDEAAPEMGLGDTKGKVKKAYVKMQSLSPVRLCEDCDDVFVKLRKEIDSCVTHKVPARSPLRLLETNSLWAAAVAATGVSLAKQSTTTPNTKSRIVMNLRKSWGAEAAAIAIDACSLLQRLATYIGWAGEALELVASKKATTTVSTTTALVNDTSSGVRWASPISSSLTSPNQFHTNGAYHTKLKSATKRIVGCTPGLMDLPVAHLASSIGTTLKALRRKLKALYRAASSLNKAHGYKWHRNMPAAMTALGHLSHHESATVELVKKVSRSVTTLEKYLLLQSHDGITGRDIPKSTSLSSCSRFSVEDLCCSWRFEMSKNVKKHNLEILNSCTEGQESDDEVLASENMLHGGPNAPPAPWVVRESTRQPGEFFFYNTESSCSQWTLRRCEFTPKDSEIVATKHECPSMELRSRMIKHMSRYSILYPNESINSRSSHRLSSC